MHSTSVPQAVGAPKTARGEELRRWESGPRRDHRPPAPGVVWWPKTPTGTSVPTRIPSGHVSAFQYTIYISCHSLSFKEQASFNIMAAVTITVILEPKNLVCYCFHCFPIYLPWEPTPSTVKAWNPNHWTTREFLIYLNLSNSVKSRAETVIIPIWIYRLQLTTCWYDLLASNLVHTHKCLWKMTQVNACVFMAIWARICLKNSFYQPIGISGIVHPASSGENPSVCSWALSH